MGILRKKIREYEKTPSDLYLKQFKRASKKENKKNEEN